MAGRAGAGALATVPNVNILQLNNMSLLITGLSTGLVTVLCTSYASMLVYAVVYGLSVGMALHSGVSVPGASRGIPGDADCVYKILGGHTGGWRIF